MYKKTSKLNSIFGIQEQQQVWTNIGNEQNLLTLSLITVGLTYVNNTQLAS